MANLLAELQQTQQPQAARQPVNLLAELGEQQVATPQQPQSQEGQGVGDIIIGAADIAGLAGTELLKEGVKGLSVVGGLINPFTPQLEAVENAEALQAALPDFQLGEQGRALVQALTEKFKNSPEIVQEIVGAASTLGPGLSEMTFQATEGLPAEIRGGLSAAAGAIPGALEAAATLKGGRAVAETVAAAPDAVATTGKALTLIDQGTGLPTPQFEKALKAKGLTIDNVGQEMLALPSGIEPKQAVNSIIRRKLINNEADDALATFRLSKAGVVEDDLIATEALRQGLQHGDIQAIKTASPETKRGFNQMIKMTRQIKANSSLAKKFRPTDVVGKSVMRRFSHIRDSADVARKQLDKIARTKLGNLSIDTFKIEDDLLKQFDDLDITVNRAEGTGQPILDFEGSLISKDRTSQAVIQDAIDLLSESKTPNALKAHKLKKQLDTMLDFNKKSTTGLTDAGKKVVGNLRKSLNNSIRDVSDEYGAVNDVLHESIGALDEFQRVLGPSIDVYREGAAKAIGTDMRGLLSNRKSRVRLENSINSLDDTAKNLGGNFDDNIADLTNMANILDDRFGAVAKTSLKGEVGGAIKQGLRGREGFVEAVVDRAAEGIEKARGINDQSTFKVMEELIRRDIEL
jgi:hypothetical protein